MQTLVVMVKEPRPGRVKTRLGKDIGMTAAAWWFRHQTRDLLRHVQDPRWQTVLAISPDVRGMRSRVWPRHLHRMAQGQGDLGDRMTRAIKAQEPGPVCVIGADIPGITRAHIAHAFQALGPVEAVFGPAPDGGYWLVGVKNSRSVPVQLFNNVRWSSSHALADTIVSLDGRSFRYVDCLRDVDTLADLRMTAPRAHDTPTL